MIKDFPYEYKLEDGTHVTVTKAGDDTYEFTLTPTHGNTKHFRYTDYERPKAEVEATLDFEQLDALRAFWRKMEE